MKSILSTLFLAALAIAVQAAPVEITATGPDRPTVTEGAGAKTLKVRLDGNLHDLTVRAEIRKWTERNPVATVAPAPAKKENELNFQLPDLGIYHVTVIVERDGKPVATTECAYSAVPRRLSDADRPQEMGTCTHFAQGKGNDPTTFELLKLAGFTRIRDDLSWEDIEPEAGKYRIRKEMDQLVNTADRYGIKTLFVAGYINPRAYPDKFTKAFPTTQEMLDAYGERGEACMRAAVREFAADFAGYLKARAAALGRSFDRAFAVANTPLDFAPDGPGAAIWACYSDPRPRKLFEEEFYSAFGIPFGA